MSWTSALRRGGVIRTPAVLPTHDGSLVARISGERHAVLFEFAEGSEPSATMGLQVVGEIAARLHEHARGWVRPAGFTRFAWDLPGALGTASRPGRWGDWRAAADAQLHPLLERAHQRLCADLEAYGDDHERFGLIHADLRAANLLATTAEPEVMVIDFDDCGLSWYAYDLASSVSFLEHRADINDLVEGWLEGYRRAGAMGPEDLRALPALLMMRRLQLLAWTASHAGTEMVRSLGPDFAEQSAGVADRYLGNRLLARLS